MSLTQQKCYLLGLICGRGHIYIKDMKVIVEFVDKNSTISGIAHCPKCGWLATEKRQVTPIKSFFARVVKVLLLSLLKRYMNRKTQQFSQSEL